MRFKHIEEAVEQLRCAEINCDNIQKSGLVFVEVVKMQIQEAIKLLGEEPMSETKVGAQPLSELSPVLERFCGCCEQFTNWQDRCSTA
jgi:hypothetical protein